MDSKNNIFKDMNEAAMYIQFISDDEHQIKKIIMDIVERSSDVSADEKLTELSNLLPPEIKQQIYEVFSYPVLNTYIRSFFSLDKKRQIPKAISDKTLIEILKSNDPNRIVIALSYIATLSKKQLRELDNNFRQLGKSSSRSLVMSALPIAFSGNIDGFTFCEIVRKYKLQYPSLRKALPKNLFYSWLKESNEKFKPIDNAFVALMFKTDSDADKYLDLYIGYIINFFSKQEIDSLLRHFKYTKDTKIVNKLESELMGYEQIPITRGPITHVVPQGQAMPKSQPEHEPIIPVDMDEYSITDEDEAPPITQRSPISLKHDSYKPKSSVDEAGNIVISQIDLLHYFIKKACR